MGPGAIAALPTSLPLTLSLLEAPGTMELTQENNTHAPMSAAWVHCDTPSKGAPSQSILESKPGRCRHTHPIPSPSPEGKLCLLISASQCIQLLQQVSPELDCEQPLGKSWLNFSKQRCWFWRTNAWLMGLQHWHNCGCLLKVFRQSSYNLKYCSRLKKMKGYKSCAHIKGSSKATKLKFASKSCLLQLICTFKFNFK